MASTPGFEPGTTLVRGSMRHPYSPSVPLARHALSSRFRKMQNIHLEEKERILKEDRRTLCLHVVFVFVASNVTVPTFLKGLLMLDKQDLRTRVGGRIFKT